MLLSELPAEILYIILAHLPNVNALANLSQTCHRLHKTILDGESVIFREFVQTRFPGIETPPYWRDAAQALTSRSRAMYKKGITARFIVPSDWTKLGHQGAIVRDRSTLGYKPPISSYEIWNGGSWADRKEVMAWGAGNQLVMRVNQHGHSMKQQWVVLDELDALDVYDDIRSLHLLSSQKRYQNDTDVEHLIFGRARGDISHMVISHNEGKYEHKQIFKTNEASTVATDLSKGPNPVLAATFQGDAVGFYHAETDEEEIEPFAILHPLFGTISTTRLLSSSTVAIGTGLSEGSLSISQITPTGVSHLQAYSLGEPEWARIEHSYENPPAVQNLSRETFIGAIEPLGAHSLTGGSPGDVFLTAWESHSVRLHDLRAPDPVVNIYVDNTDTNPIYSLLSFGHDSFLVGSGGEGLVKIFDLRMGTKSRALDTQMETGYSYRAPPHHYPEYGFSTFLSTPAPDTFTNEAAHPFARYRESPSGHRQPNSYRGPVYAMSSPSPSSPTVYAGVVGGIVQLDFVSTDDLFGPNREWCQKNLGLDLNTTETQFPDPSTQVMNLGGYERPAPYDFGSVSKLRRQREFWKIPPEDMLNGYGQDSWDWRWGNVEQRGTWRSLNDS
ncbi:uncharacterized protein N7515_001510 [Penicillium bovifimosum]|uniref:F-box domain-containing protein n=1 Tax=Penicillium bovifimosum TaxID=126998 RepID=A0A9W9HA38_9EURO|nr:uncharacterized protein N7515_001510 [Penicillium bovifimosum]KAJ5142723.1 hypothetical protein N7515_001510 [Penicillium bovifimosum]